MGGEPRVSSHHLHSLLPSGTSRDRWLSVLLWRNQRPRACGPKRYGWLSENKGGASRHQGRSEKAIHSTGGPTIPVLRTTRISEKKT